VAKATTPADLTITPRDRRFGRDAQGSRWWMNGDPVATAFFNALSLTFPKGEAMFIEAVKAHRDGVPDQLAQEIRAFTQQEVIHSREHLAFNRRVVEAGYDVSRLDARIDEMMAIASSRPAIVRLAATMALEHYTAILAAMILTDDALFADTPEEDRSMWQWHAIEEIEHKGVAYDTWMHATRDWGRFRRWRVKTIMMLIITVNFWRHRIEGTLDLLRQDGITGWRARLALARYLLVSPGIIRRIFPAWLTFFLPGFHPWNHDDRALIRRIESDYAAAVQPQQSALAA